MTESTRSLPGDPTFAAAFVFGLEGTPTDDDYHVAVQRLQRAIRPWDSVVDVGSRSVGVVCTTLTSAREVDAIATRLADVVRAPMAVGDAVRTLGVCVGAAVLTAGEQPATALARARDAMTQMRSARAGLLAPELPAPRQPGAVAIRG